MSHHVLVPVDGSQPARDALAFACEHFPDARLTILYAVDPMSEYSRHRTGYGREHEYDNEREKAEAVLEATLEDVPDDVDAETSLEVGSVARTIVEYADAEDLDQIIMGSHGREGPARYLLGSVAETVVRRAGVPVTVVRTEDTA
ncbi:universal stress protein [Natrialbaceae archaeon AArc-T1-2]|uniref:universal stress protein n=1 Tax=Natrialbaceae archaeon AArc-T1-2 TaxID=3053904 RepID=UPI00255ABBE9|nr:universal stress protein [Natrialbaceae archaeon AArc-T1-2]WIV68621.1 universal stress protein [Natrialbaceae archaeon AArc-T1-2]